MFLMKNPRLKGHRARAVTVSLLVLGTLSWLVVQPLPMATVVEGVVWIPEDARMRTGVDGFVERLEVDSGAQVTTGQVLMISRNPELASRAAVLEARLAELTAQMESYQRQDLVQLELAREQVETVRAQLADVRVDLDSLVLRSHADGVFVISESKDLVGSFLPRGTTVGFVSKPRAVVARVAVPQSNVDLIRSDTRAVEVRMAHDLGRSVAAEIEREVPGATQVIPSMVLAVEGGGSIPIDPRAKNEPITFEALFQFDIAFALEEAMPRYGERVYVRFEHGSETAARQLYRQVRQVFLKRFDA